MINEKDILISRKIMQKLISDEAVKEADEKFITFFMGKAETSLQTAMALLKLSDSNEAKRLLQFPQGYDAYMWVINAGYYSMFYAATALLAAHNHKLNVGQGIHSLTYHALVYYFLDSDKKIAKHMLEQYSIAEREASELLQAVETKAKEQIGNVRLELSKRREFTYEIGKTAEKHKAETSVKRASEFLTLVKELMLHRKQ